MKKLAIIIPAYKSCFLSETLESIARQSNHEFTLYIGDDASPDCLEEIVTSYKDRLDIVYYRFEQNLGGKNLIRHWERCIEMMRGEEFFCLFSDDDLMESHCVEQFYNILDNEKEGNFDVFHFNINIINSKGITIKECSAYPPVLSSSDFFHLLYTGCIDARMPEFIFKTASFKQNGGFVEFDMAYRSDNATVMLHAIDKGICSITGGRVLWRDSGLNLSSKYDQTLYRRKAVASVDFFNWCNVFFSKMGLHNPLETNQIYRWISDEILRIPNLALRKRMLIFLNWKTGKYRMDIVYRFRFLRSVFINKL